MSTLSFIEKKCYCCGTINRFGESSVHSFSVPDGLDGHPGNLTPLYTAINICPVCHYSAPDIAEGSEEIAAIVKSEGYLKIAENETIHELVRKYIAWAYIKTQLGNSCEAARTLLYATWLSQQYEDDGLTSQCRRNAINLMSRCRSNGGNFEITRGKEILTMVDLYRREGQFTDALEICEAVFSSGQINEDDEFLLRYEEKLCREENRNFATIHDAEKKL
jgi:hypothetical protein